MLLGSSWNDFTVLSTRRPSASSRPEPLHTSRLGCGGGRAEPSCSSWLLSQRTRCDIAPAYGRANISPLSVTAPCSTLASPEVKKFSTVRVVLWCPQGLIFPVLSTVPHNHQGVVG